MIFHKVCLLAIAIFSLLAPQALAAPPEPAGKFDPISIYKETGIDQEQEKTIRGMASSFEERARNRAKQLLVLLRDMRDLSMQENPSQELVLNKQNEINTLNSEMANDRIKLMLAIRQKLTPGQRHKLVSLMKKSPDPDETKM